MTTGEHFRQEMFARARRKVIARLFTFLGVWRAQRDVMNDMVATEAEDNP